MSQMYQLQRIVRSRVSSKGKKEYLIKWVGYNSDQNTWEPEQNLKFAKDQLNRFQKIQQSMPFTNKYTQKDEDSGKQEQYSQVNISSDGYQSVEKQESQSGYQQRIIHKKKQPEAGRIEKEQTKLKKPIKKQEKSNKKLVILGMALGQTGEYIYRIRKSGKDYYVARRFLVPKYLQELCDFYENHVIIG